jgi:C4-dicarboxylate-specific signal transduction histidine kinase
MASPSRSMLPNPKAGPRDAPVKVAELLHQVIEELAGLIARRNAELEVGRTAEELLVRGPESAVRQILHHLLRNALEATPNCGLVRINMHQQAGQVMIEVSDEGPGIAAQYMSKIFRRGFTTKAGCKGQGLAEVEESLGRLRGAIAWESPLRSGRGCRFTLTLSATVANPADK